MRWKGQDYHFPMHAKHESGRTLNCSWHKVYVLNEASFIAWKSPSVGSFHAGLYTVFENHKKSLIKHCERSELHFIRG